MFFRKLINKNDIQEYSNLTEIIDVVFKKELELDSKEFTPHQDIISDDDFLILKPLNIISSRKYGASTKWCTSSSNPETFYDYSKSLEQTKNAITYGTSVIYEAAFQFEGVLCAVDILVRDGNMWNAYEVKSTTSVKETHITDASLQYHVMKNCGIQIKDMEHRYQQIQ